MTKTLEKALAVGVLGLAALAAVAVLKRGDETAPPDAEGAGDAPSSERADRERSGDGAAKDPRLVLGRLWFDRLPKKRTDVYDLWLFFGGGIGIEDKGSSYRSTLDVFDFERQGSKIDMTFLQDKKKQTLHFEVVSCSDKPPFDLCLDLKEPLRGQKRLYSFDDAADMDANIPWSRALRASAESRARAPRE